jgi:hypothetical protein
MYLIPVVQTSPVAQGQEEEWWEASCHSKNYPGKVKAWLKLYVFAVHKSQSIGTRLTQPDRRRHRQCPEISLGDKNITILVPWTNIDHFIEI